MQRGLHWDQLLLQNIHIDTYTQFNGRKSQFWTRSGTQRAILLKESIHICSTQALECFNGGPSWSVVMLAHDAESVRVKTPWQNQIWPFQSWVWMVIVYLNTYHFHTSQLCPWRRLEHPDKMSDNSNLHWLQRSLIAASDHMIFN